MPPRAASCVITVFYKACNITLLLACGGMRPSSRQGVGLTAAGSAAASLLPTAVVKLLYYFATWFS